MQDSAKPMMYSASAFDIATQFCVFDDKFTIFPYDANAKAASAFPGI